MGKPKNEGGVSKKNKVNRNGPTKAPHKQSVCFFPTHLSTI